jgi:hypothetical protein
MTIYFPYGLIAVGLSIYAFNAYRKRRAEFSLQRRNDLKDVRQEWLDHQLGRKTSDIILYSPFMEQKINTLKKMDESIEGSEEYYIDDITGEKWIKEYFPGQIDADEFTQLRKVQQFPFE